LASVAVIGAGAAGLAAAIFAAENSRGQGVALLEGADSIGAKILISGGGRCNVTHFEVSPSDFNGSPNIVRNVLAAFGVAATRHWFASMGVELKQEETGKLFPVTDSARTVIDALLRRCAELSVAVSPGRRVQRVSRADGMFEIEDTLGMLRWRSRALSVTRSPTPSRL
jgi:predicted Rossmann fold flavoprotein